MIGDEIVFSNADLSVTVTVTDIKDDGEIIQFDWEATIVIDGVFVKAGDGGNWYDYVGNGFFPTSDTMLVTPDEKGVSHFSFCYDPNNVQQTFTIEGAKFYDADASGSFTAGEAGIPGWTIYLDNDTDFTNGVVASVLTDATGHYLFTNMGTPGPGVEVVPTLGEGTWYVYEGAAISSATWQQTLGGGTAVTGDPAPAPALGATVGAYCIVLTEMDSASAENDFGNLCLGAGGGHTLGFWSNKNGQAIINANLDDALNALNDLNLVDANGNPKTFTSAADIKSWLLNATATNMAYMLSAQLAAMQLNVLLFTWSGGTDGVDGGSLVYAPGCGNTGVGSNYITINDLIAAANTELGTHPTAFSGDDWRAYQECLKDALDDANNNQNFVQPGPC
jgi:hypothetical protein